MGNHNSSHGSPTTGKVILIDGSIHEFDNPLTVAELMLEHPQQVVVELKQATLAQRKPPSPLPADNKLELDKFYLMVPLRRGKPAHLSSQEAHHILLAANAMLRSKTTVPWPKFLPFFARIFPATSIDNAHQRLRVPKPGEMSVSKETEMEGCDEVEDFEVVEKIDHYHLSGQLSGRGWKPSLDTIIEKKNEIRKGSKLVMLASDVGKRIESKGLVWG